jgi:hypothetical protein
MICGDRKMVKGTLMTGDKMWSDTWHFGKYVGDALLQDLVHHTALFDFAVKVLHGRAYLRHLHLHHSWNSWNTGQNLTVQCQCLALLSPMLSPMQYARCISLSKVRVIQSPWFLSFLSSFRSCFCLHPLLLCLGLFAIEFARLSTAHISSQLTRHGSFHVVSVQTFWQYSSLLGAFWLQMARPWKRKKH